MWQMNLWPLLGKFFPCHTIKRIPLLVGYGALINGLKYQDTFGYIGAFSPGPIVDHLDPISKMKVHMSGIFVTSLQKNF